MTKKIVLLGSYGSNDGVVNLSRKLLLDDDVTAVEVDLTYLKWMELGPMTYLLGTLKGWQEKGIQVSFSEIHQMSSPVGYMSRMNFFTLLGCSVDDDRTRNVANNKFVDYREIAITERGGRSADVLADNIATCIVGEQDETKDFVFSDDLPEAGFYDSLVYSVTELVKNVQQHSQGIGYVGAQYYPKSGVTQIAITDTGIGIRESFISSGSPYAANISDDASALEKAFEAEVSSKSDKKRMFGSSENAGVGLTFLKELIIKTGGSYQAASGVAILQDGISNQLSSPYRGTYVSLSFRREELERFHHLLEDVKRQYLGKLDANSDELMDVFGD